MCHQLAKDQREHGELIAIRITRGPRWSELDDLARAQAGALQENRQPGSVWLQHGRWIFTKREHLDGIAAALANAGALDRLEVRHVPVAVN
jgi:hypothetical protein